MAEKISETLKERKTTHGDFDENSEISQIIKTIIRTASSYHQMTPAMRESLDMIAHKIGRIVCGDPYYSDHWHDIIGYAALVEKELEKEEVEKLN